VILPEDMRQIAPRFAKAGLTARLVETDDPDVEDDQIEIFRDGIDTRVQIALIGGGYHVNEYRGEDATFVMIARGSFRVLRKAIDQAIEIIKAKQLATQHTHATPAAS
jgi:hypothetical protein